MTEAIHVFAYGTLRAGEANDLRVAASRRGIAEPKLIGHATLHGRLYDFGAYPGLVPDPTGTAVRGDVYRIDPGLCRCSTRSKRSTLAATRCSCARPTP